MINEKNYTNNLLQLSLVSKMIEIPVKVFLIIKTPFKSNIQITINVKFQLPTACAYENQIVL